MFEKILNKFLTPHTSDSPLTVQSVDPILSKAIELIGQSSMSEWNRTGQRSFDSADGLGRVSPSGFLAHLGGQQVIVGTYPGRIYDEWPTPPQHAICVGEKIFSGDEVAKAVQQFEDRILANQEKKLALVGQVINDIFENKNQLTNHQSNSAIQALTGDSVSIRYFEQGNLQVEIERSVDSRISDIEKVVYKIKSVFDDGLTCVARTIKFEAVEESKAIPQRSSRLEPDSSPIFRRTKDTDRLFGDLELEINGEKICATYQNEPYYKGLGKLQFWLPALKKNILIDESAILQGFITIRTNSAESFTPNDKAYNNRYISQSKSEEQSFLKAAALYYEDNN